MNKIIKKLLIIACFLLLLVLLVPVATFARFHIESRHALAESKNVELALRLVAIEYYGRDKKIYDPLRADGLADGVADQVRDLSGAEGELTLGSWNAARGAADRFTYTTGKLVVVYQYDEQEEHRWKLCYQFREVMIPDYGTGA